MEIHVPPLAPRTSVLDDIGNPDAEPGSLPWARWFVFRAKKRREDLESDATALRGLIEKLDRHEAWRPLNYPSLGMLCQLEIGLTEEEMDGLKRPTIQVVIDHPRDTARQLARHFDTVQLADLMDAINEILKARA